MPRPIRSARLSALVLLGGAALSACALVSTPPTRTGASPIDSDPVQVILRLGERRLYLVDAESGAPPESFPIAIGKEGWETPVGRFAVDEMVEHPEFFKFDPADPSRIIKRIPPGPANPLGERWIGFARGEGWSVGLHGTPQPELLGRAVSHGCVRMRNADVVRVYERVKLGTPVIVDP